jgi:hypothetical protein
MATSLSLGSFLERSAHVVEAAVRRGQQRARERNQDPREPLRLDVSAAATFSRMDLMDVFTVEDAGDPETTQPAERPRWDDGSDGRSERPGFFTGRPDDHPKLLADLERTLGLDDERVPLRYRAKSVRIRQTCWGGAAISMSARSCLATRPSVVHGRRTFVDHRMGKRRMRP